MMNAQKWYLEYKKNSQAAIRVFCFHHSGGGASTYFSWVDLLSPQVELIAIQLPGRENRFSEPLTNDLSTIMTKLCEEFSPYKDKPFFVFGHSLGALISFEFIKFVYQSYSLYPCHMIVSAAKAPHLPFRMQHLSLLDNERLVEELKLYKGVDDSILENNELREMLLPILRNDFSIGEKYNCKELSSFPFDILALSGSHDPTVNEEEILGWSSHTTGKFDQISFPGSHFFIKDHQNKIIEIINRVSERYA